MRPNDSHDRHPWSCEAIHACSFSMASTWLFFKSQVDVFQSNSNNIANTIQDRQSNPYFEFSHDAESRMTRQFELVVGFFPRLFVRIPSNLSFTCSQFFVRSSVDILTHTNQAPLEHHDLLHSMPDKQLWWLRFFLSNLVASTTGSQNTRNCHHATKAK